MSFLRKFFAAGFAGAVGCVVGTPGDVLKIRLINDLTKAKYKGNFIKKTIRILRRLKQNYAIRRHRRVHERPERQHRASHFCKRRRTSHLRRGQGFPHFKIFVKLIRHKNSLHRKFFRGICRWKYIFNYQGP